MWIILRLWLWLMIWIKVGKAVEQRWRAAIKWSWSVLSQFWLLKNRGSCWYDQNQNQNQNLVYSLRWLSMYGMRNNIYITPHFCQSYVLSLYLSQKFLISISCCFSICCSVRKYSSCQQYFDVRFRNRSFLFIFSFLPVIFLHYSVFIFTLHILVQIIKQINLTFTSTTNY